MSFVADCIPLVFAGVGTVLAVAYLVACSAANRRYRPLVENLDDDKHLFKSVYALGFWVLDAFPSILTTNVAQKRASQCLAIHGKVYAEYYTRLNFAQKLSVGLLFIPFSFLAYPLVNSPLALLVGVGGAVLAWWYYDMQITDEMEKRDDEIARDLPDVLSKLTLLVNAGMILREAWTRVAATGDTTIYKEMRNADLEMQNGTSEAQAILSFGNRCMSPEIKKFASTLAQNLSKGNRELTEYLLRQSAMSWEEKKQYARQKGESASSKLMIPIAGMMVGIMIMVVVPIFGNLGF